MKDRESRLPPKTMCFTARYNEKSNADSITRIALFASCSREVVGEDMMNDGGRRVGYRNLIRRMKNGE